VNDAVHVLQDHGTAQHDLYSQQALHAASMGVRGGLLLPEPEQNRLCCKAWGWKAASLAGGPPVAGCTAACCVGPLAPPPGETRWEDPPLSAGYTLAQKTK